MGSVMSATATSTTRGVRGDQTPAGAFTSVLHAAVGGAAAKLEQHVDGWADKLNGLADGGGARQTAGIKGLKAALHGKNPLWAAFKGAWQGGTPVVRAAIVAAVVAAILLLVLSPVLLIVFLLSLLIIAAVHRARAAKK